MPPFTPIYPHLPPLSSILRYPFVHPNFAQSQLFNLTGHNHHPPTGTPLHPTPALFLEATLSPGEMLYIPPMWYHAATALEGSVSLNAWTESGQQRTYHQAFERDLTRFNAI